MKTKVIFKKITFFHKNKGGITEINAIFPEISEGKNLVLSYAHIGQHSAIHTDFLKNFKDKVHLVESATENEYRDLYNELTNIVGYELEIIK